MYGTQASRCRLTPMLTPLCDPSDSHVSSDPSDEHSRRILRSREVLRCPEPGQRTPRRRMSEESRGRGLLRRNRIPNFSRESRSGLQGVGTGRRDYAWCIQLDIGRRQRQRRTRRRRRHQRRHWKRFGKDVLLCHAILALAPAIREDAAQTASDTSSDAHHHDDNGPCGGIHGGRVISREGGYDVGLVELELRRRR